MLNSKPISKIDCWNYYCSCIGFVGAVVCILFSSLYSLNVVIEVQGYLIRVQVDIVDVVGQKSVRLTYTEIYCCVYEDNNNVLWFTETISGRAKTIQGKNVAIGVHIAVIVCFGWYRWNSIFVTGLSFVVDSDWKSILRPVFHFSYSNFLLCVSISNFIFYKTLKILKQWYIMEHFYSVLRNEPLLHAKSFLENG